MPLTFGGRPASQVATRHATLPLLDPAIAAKRDHRRAADADRLDRHIQAAAWRGSQVNWHRERIRRLQPIQNRHARWLDAHDWRHPLWPKRNRRYWFVATVILAHERELRGYIEKVDDLVKHKSANQQEAITRAYFSALHAPPPAHKPPAVMEVVG